MENFQLEMNIDFTDEPYKSVEERLEEAIESSRKGENYPEEEVWARLAEKYGFKL